MEHEFGAVLGAVNDLHYITQFSLCALLNKQDLKQGTGRNTPLQFQSA